MFCFFFVWFQIGGGWVTFCRWSHIASSDCHKVVDNMIDTVIISLSIAKTMVTVSLYSWYRTYNTISQYQNITYTQVYNYVISYWMTCHTIWTWMTLVPAKKSYEINGKYLFRNIMMNWAKKSLYKFSTIVYISIVS